MIVNRVVWLLLLLLTAGIYVFTNTYATLLLFFLSLLLPAVSLALMLLSGRGLVIQLTVPAAAEKQRADIGCELTNPGRIPVARLILLLRLENQMNGQSMAKRLQSAAGGGETVRAILRIQDCLAGEIAVRAESARICDVFGLFTKKIPVPEPKRMLVYPDQSNITVLTEQTEQTFGEGTRYSQDRAGQDVTELFSIREYEPGDEIRSIHWKLSSKLGKMLTREFSQPVHYTVTVLLELDGTDADLLDRVLSEGISLSEALLDQGLAHDLAWLDAAEETLQLQTMDSFEALDAACGQILSTSAAKIPGAGLAQLLEHYRIEELGKLIYVASGDAALQAALPEEENITVLTVTREDRLDEEKEIII